MAPSAELRGCLGAHPHQSQRRVERTSKVGRVTFNPHLKSGSPPTAGQQKARKHTGQHASGGKSWLAPTETSEDQLGAGSLESISRRGESLGRAHGARTDRVNGSRYSKSPAMTDAERDLFRDYVERECAIIIGEDKKYLIEARLGRLLSESGSSSYAEFYRKVVSSTDRVLRDKIVEAITINETLWFRDSQPFVALRDFVLPELLQRRQRQAQPIRIWSAGCSTGQEAYSIAMLVDWICSQRPDSGAGAPAFEIVATDISGSALRFAAAGRYDRVSMKRGFEGEWSQFRDRYFETHGAVSELLGRVRLRVHFARHNLQDDFTRLKRFDLILLRYVAIYFADGFKHGLFSRLADSLSRGGILMLGAAETLGQDPGRFRAERLGGAYFYRVVEQT